MTSTPPSSDSNGDTPPRRGLRPGWTSRIPSHVLGGFRTTTVVLVALFVLILVLWNSVRFDPTKNENSPVYVPPAPTTTTEVPQETYVPTATRAPTTTPSATSTTEPTDTAVPTGPETGSTSTGSTNTTTQAPPFQLPTIPGLTLPTTPN